MINMFNGKLVLKQENNLFLENGYNFKKIYVCKPNDYKCKKEYKLYIYTYKTQLNKGLDVKINFGFNSINDVINFEELIMLDEIGIKTALKIINEGYDQFIELIKINDIETIKEKYLLSKEQLSILINYFNIKIINSFSPSEANKMREAFDKLKSFGLKEELIARSIWKNKDKVINNEFSKILDILLDNIKKEQKRTS